MALTAEELLVYRKWVGEEADGAPSDAVLNTLYDLYLNHDQAVLHVLTQRLTTMSLDYGSITVPGLSISRSADYQALESLIAKFKNEGGTGLEEEFSFGLKTVSVKKNFPR